MGKVLVVDDQPAIRKLICEVLSDEFEMRFAGKAEEAISVCSEFKPDIILLDIGLEGMNGIEALPCLKKLVPSCSIIMLTGNTNSHLIQEALACGASDCICKPFDIFMMKAKLESIISKKTAS